MSALVEELAQRGLLQDTAIIWMVNSDARRESMAMRDAITGGPLVERGGWRRGHETRYRHWETNEDGTEVVGNSWSSEDLMASVCKSLGISLETTFTSTDGRPMKIANMCRVITELFA